MARSSVSKKSGNLNLSPHQVTLLQKILLHGNEMSKIIKPKNALPTQKEKDRAAKKWENLKTEFYMTL